MTASDYPNGQIPLSELAQVGYNVDGVMQYLEPTAAQYWTALVVKAASQGVALNCLEGYRSYAEQVRLRNLYLNDPDDNPPAGIPGTSKHGEGKAVDVYNSGGFLSAKYAWLASNAPAYGFTNTQGRADGEAWHWVFAMNALVIPASQIGSTPITKEEAMALPFNLTKYKDGQNPDMWLLIGPTADHGGFDGPTATQIAKVLEGDVNNGIGPNALIAIRALQAKERANH